MPNDIQIQPGQTVEVSLPQWLMKEKGFASRELSGEVLRVTPKAIQVRAHAIIRESDACHRCGLAIDNPASRLLGYGPICSDYLGLPHAEVYAAMSPEEKRAILAKAEVETVRECWLPLSQVVIRSVTGAPAATAFPNDPARAGLEALLSGRTDEAEAAVAALQQQPAPAPRNPRRIVWDAGMYRVLFPYNPELVQAVKRIPGYRWDNANKRWSFPAGAGAELLRFAAEHGFEVEEEAAAQAQALRETEERNLAESRAAEADFQVEGLGGTLRPFQSAGVRYCVRQRRVLVGDQPGLGKTVQDLATVQAENAFPHLVICPASLKLNWAREARRWLPGRSVQVLAGTKPAPITGDVVIINYDILGYWMQVQPAPGQEMKKRPKMVCTGPLAEYGFRSLGCDESHNLKNHKAKRTQMVQALAAHIREQAAQQGFDAITLLLSGTPVLNRPAELIAPLQILDRLDDLGGFRHFAVRYCGTIPEMGWDLSGATNLEELNERMRAVCYVRRVKKDVLKELPEKVRTTVPLQLDNRKEYDRAERDLVGFVRETSTEDRRFRASIAGLSDEEKKAAMRERQEDKVYAARQAEALVRVNVLKQVAAKGKMAGVLEWVRSFLESGEKLVIGAWHQEVVETLARELHAPYIHGGVSLEERDRAVNHFQHCATCGVRHDEHSTNVRACGEYRPDMTCPVIVLNTRSGGVGLTLTAASDIAVVELPWTPGDLDQLEDRIHRIGQENTATAWYLLAQDTIDEDVAALLDSKREVVDGATDGEGREASASIMRDLMKRLRERQGESESETEALQGA